MTKSSLTVMKMTLLPPPLLRQHPFSHHIHKEVFLLYIMMVSLIYKQEHIFSRSGSRLAQSILATREFSRSPASLVHVTATLAASGNDDGRTATTGSHGSIHFHPTTATSCVSLRPATATVVVICTLLPCGNICLGVGIILITAHLHTTAR